MNERPPGTANYRFGRFEIRTAERQLQVEGRAVALGARAFDVLVALAERRNRVVPKSELLDVVWPNLIVEENNLQVHVSALRKLLGPQAITTVPGRGYRFTAGGDAPPGSDGAPAAPAPPAAAATRVDPVHPGNIPPRPPPLLGRDAELEALVKRVEAHPLVSLLGAGGIGKTTLALAAADRLRRSFPDGAWFVGLEHATGRTDLAQFVAQTLRLPVAGAGPALGQLTDLLARRSMLIVLDNCEHLLDAVAPLANALTTQAPDVRLLATSQALLNVSGEQSFRLDVLSLPSAGELPSVDEHGAIALFVERARVADSHFTLNSANAGAVADICRRLDGMPLAIELAAARVRSIGVQGVRERLDERFRLLTGGARTSAPRHQTLLAALDWSHALLSAEEQAVLRRLSVFVGGFSLELAQKVAGDVSVDEWAVLDALAALVDKSLVIADQGETPRYRLLETTRAYALKLLAAAGEDRTYRDRHMQAVRDLFVPSEEARVAASELRMGRASGVRLHSEIDNLRAALDWAASTDADVRSSIALAGAGASQFILAGLTKEGLDRMLPLRSKVDAHAPPRQAALFYLDLVRLGTSGRLPRDVLLDAADRSVQVHRALGSRLPLLNALLLQGKAMSEVGMVDACDAVLSEVLALEQAGDSVYYAFSRLNIQAQLAKQRQRPDEALRLYIERRELLVAGSADEVTLRLADADICTTLSELGRFEEALTLADALIERGSPKGIGLEFVTLHKVNAEIMLRRTEAARQTTFRYLSLWRNAGFLMYNLDAFAVMVADDGKFADAARLAGASQAFVRRTQVWLPPLGPDWDQVLPARFAAAGVALADVERWKQQGEAMEEPELAALLDCGVSDC